MLCRVVGGSGHHPLSGQSPHVSTAVLGGLIAVLQCGIEDLIAVTKHGAEYSRDLATPAY